MDWNQYSKALFFDTTINKSWVTKCKKYLLDIFGNSIQNSIILDYGFGRGNWSIAFSELGAKKVFSVDISEHNVSKFQNFLLENGLHKQIKCVRADFSETNSSVPYHDLLWSYGIFHHLRNPAQFIKNVSKLSDTPKFGLIYAYEVNSLRSEVIQLFRQFLDAPVNPILIDFKKFYNKRIYMRCIDDYCAPTINFYSFSELEKICKPIFYPETVISQVDSFSHNFGDFKFELDFSAVHLRFGRHNFEFKKICFEKKWNQFLYLKTRPFIKNLESLLVLQKKDLTLEKRISITINFHNLYYSSFSHGQYEFVKNLPLFLKSAAV